MHYPLVSVVMPVFNAERYIKEAIESILNQTYHNLEFIIVYDKSSDHTLDIILSYDDERIKLLVNEESKGLAFALNRGLEHSRGKYIIRMDSDDISLPDRIEKQVDFLENHPSVGVCAGLAEILGNRQIKAYLPAITSEEIKCSLLFDTTIAHPTVAMRADLIKEHNLRYPDYSVEDYLMWVSALDYCKFYVLPEVILKYRITGQSLTAVIDNEKEALKKEAYLTAYDIMLKRCGITASLANRTLQYDFDWGRLEKEEMKALTVHLNSILKANARSRYFDGKTLMNIIGKRWIAYIRRNKQYKYLFSKFTFYGIRYIIARLVNNPMK